MNIRDEIQAGRFPRIDDVNNEELQKLFWQYLGLEKEQQRERAYWSATNENLKSAYEKLNEKDRELQSAYTIIREDLSMANRIQDSLLPTPTPAMARDLEIAVFHRQLAEVGGDYYDFFSLKQGGYAVGLFDISGHGVSAALVMTYLKAQFMMVMERLSSPREIVEWVNSVSLAFMRTAKKYAALNFVLFNGRKIRYVSGGGNGLLVSKGGPVLFEKKDQFLGLRARPFHEYEVDFAQHDLLALYTDGIVEAQNEDGEDFSKRRLNELIIANWDKPVNEIIRICREDYGTFRMQDSDDITLIILRKRGSNGN